MEKYTATYLKYFGFQIPEDCYCEKCGNLATSIHHIHGRIGKNANAIENLSALCFQCHTDCHMERISKDEMQSIHDKFMSRNW